ncbi:hypothetical protein BDF20DRAFT_833916 [Mycotypha africana]|uniref:uncharacterized protein n=1 Tax=Mycotypha africana TaxID=64632 RepID=UPI002301B430|nr:uncharacterized protein BDF20DRAFT_833916 [Mycotypha africana]KAI8984405.1 hypothetical protein BDF20DRAFT_833916 [Mycotypha africana]
MLLDGVKEYNSRKRKKSCKESCQEEGKQRRHVFCRYKAKTVKRLTAAPFFEDHKEIPLIIYDDGLKNKDCTAFKGQQTDVTEKLYHSLLERERRLLAAVVRH